MTDIHLTAKEKRTICRSSRTNDVYRGRTGPVTQSHDLWCVNKIRTFEGGDQGGDISFDYSKSLPQNVLGNLN